MKSIVICTTMFRRPDVSACTRTTERSPWMAASCRGLIETRLCPQPLAPPQSVAVMLASGGQE